eukprot:RCo034781
MSAPVSIRELRVWGRLLLCPSLGRTSVTREFSTATFTWEGSRKASLSDLLASLSGTDLPHLREDRWEILDRNGWAEKFCREIAAAATASPPKLSHEAAVRAYTVAIRQCFKQSRPRIAEEIFRRMVHTGIAPTAEAYTALIAGFSLSEVDQERVLRYAAEMTSKGLVLSSEVYAALLTVQCSRGNDNEVKRITDEMLSKGCQLDASMYGAVIRAHGRKGRAEEIDRCCREMEDRGIAAGVDFLVTLVEAYAEAQAPSYLLELYSSLAPPPPPQLPQQQQPHKDEAGSSPSSHAAVLWATPRLRDAFLKAFAPISHTDPRHTALVKEILDGMSAAGMSPSLESFTAL